MSDPGARQAARDTRPGVQIQLSPARFAQLFTPETEARLRSLAEVAGPTEALAPPDALARAEVLLTSIGSALDREALDSAPRLRWIASANAGPPRLDWDVVEARGITVTDSRRGFHRPVAELALTLYLGLMRDVALHDRALHTPQEVEGASKERNREASRRRLGLLGFGGIGQALARFLAPLEPELLVHDPYLPEAQITAAGARPVGLEELFRSCDAVFVLARPNPANRRLVGGALLDLLPRDGALIVVSRSWLVDEGALVERLRSGRIRAALDVFDAEPLAPGHPLRTLPNVILTPHRAGGTRESYHRIGRHFVEDVERFGAGLPPARMAVVEAEMMRRQGLTGGSA